MLRFMEFFNQIKMFMDRLKCAAGDVKQLLFILEVYIVCNNAYDRVH